MTDAFHDFKILTLLTAFSLLANVGCASPSSKSSPILATGDSHVESGTASATSQAVEPKQNSGKKTSRPPAAATPLKPGMHTVEKKELSALKSLNDRYRAVSSVTMDVSKLVKLGLIGSERKSSGKLFLSKGQLRMELEGAEKTLLIVNKKNLFAVTYPDVQLKDAALQVIKGSTSSKKAQSQALTSLLGAGGIFKSFKPTAVQTTESGEQTYFLQPTNDQSEFTRAQLKVSADGKEIRELHYWDSRDNETTLSFSNVKFGSKFDSNLFNYTPPANADVMNL